MAVPSRSQPYTPQTSDEVGDAVSFDVNDGAWTENPTQFEINFLPPGFTFDGTQNLGGEAGCKMLYIIFVRALNADGLSDWKPLQWTVSTVETTGRTLYGLPTVWPSSPQHPSGSTAVLEVKLAGVAVSPFTPSRSEGISEGVAGSRGSLFMNDIANVNGTSRVFTQSIQGVDIIVSGDGDTFLRASAPGWEVVIDVN